MKNAFKEALKVIMNNRTEHICVCICTYQRPRLLRRLLDELGKQNTGGLFAYSIVVVDNDRLRSAEAVVSAFTASSPIPVKYCVQHEQNIAMARNKAIENASGDYVAFIDDDEFPAENWLMTLLQACKQYGADGVLGAVNRHFDEEPPKWLVKGMFWQRPTYPTGLVIDGKKGRTGNVILKADIFARNPTPFRSEFRAGSDQDFFHRMIEQGYTFVYCNEAVVYEVVPPKRWKRSFILRRSMLQGCSSPLYRKFGVASFAKSLIAIPIYTAILPFAAMIGHHLAMNLLVKLANHSGKVLTYLGIPVIRGPYVTD